MFKVRFLIFFSFITPIIKTVHIQKNGYFLSKDQEGSSYDISHWINKLHLQHCVFVEIGEGFCSLFVELKTWTKNSENPRNSEFFLGICECETLHAWKLCSPDLLKDRKSDCIFSEGTATANTSARVHRRLCNITFLRSFAPICKCSLPLAGQKLYKTGGFPTCFLDPLPNSICFPRGVCGVAKCTVKTIMGIHSPQCDPNCHQKQPFCEEPGPWTSVEKITSSWTKWSEPKCNVSCGRGSLVSKAVCEKNNIDCIGPGPLCCHNTIETCECKVAIENGIMEVNRFTKPCTRSISCPIVLRRRGFIPENQFKEIESLGIDEYKEFDQEKVEGNVYYDTDNYEIMNRDDDKGLKNKKINKRKAAIDGDIDDEDTDYDSGTENASDKNLENEEESLPEEEEETEQNDDVSISTTENDYESVYEDKSGGSSVFQVSFLGLTYLVIFKNSLLFS